MTQLSSKSWKGKQGYSASPEAQRNSLTVSETAHRLCRSNRTIYRHIKSGVLKASRFGQGYLVPISEIERIERGELSA